MSEFPAALPSLGGNLNSLAQSAREKQIRTARNIMIFIGLLTIGVNIFLFYNLENEIRTGAAQALKEAGLTREAADPALLAEAEGMMRRVGTLIYGGTIALGVAYLVFAALVKKYPVPITITALVLYIAAALIFGLIEPTSLLQGIFIKIIIIYALARSISAAIAYEKARKTAAA